MSKNSHSRHDRTHVCLFQEVLRVGGIPTSGQGLPNRKKSSESDDGGEEETEKWSPAKHQEAVDALMGSLAGCDFEGVAGPPQVCAPAVCAHTAVNKTAVKSTI